MAAFPRDKESISVAEFVYLSPDVLRGETYVACADVYALGLLIFELILNIRAFDNQRAMTLDRFTERVDPIKMLDIDAMCEKNHVTESTKNLIEWCVHPVADKRPIIQILSEQITTLSGERCIANLRRTKSRHPIRKKSGQVSLEEHLLRK